MNKIKVSIIGLGEIAQNFYLPNLVNNHLAVITALCDIQKTKAQILSDKYEIPMYYSNMDELLDANVSDAVIICTPTNTHYELAKKSLIAKKHIYIEKPFVESYNEALELAELAKEMNLIAMVGMNNRFRYDSIMLKNYIKQNYFGKILYIYSGIHQHKRNIKSFQIAQVEDISVLYDLALTLLDSIFWITDFPEIHSIRSNVFHHSTRKIDDIALATIKLKNGSLISIEANWNQFDEKTTYYCDIHGTLGGAEVNPLRLYKKIDGKYTLQPLLQQMSNYELYKNSYRNEINNFIQILQGLTPEMSSAQESAYILKIIENIKNSSLENKEIIFE